MNSALLLTVLSVSRIITSFPQLTQDEQPVAQDAFCANIRNNIVAQRQFSSAAQNGLNLAVVRGICLSTHSNDGKLRLNQRVLNEGLQKLLADNPKAQVILHIGGLHPPPSWHAYYQNRTRLCDADGNLHVMPDPNSIEYLGATRAYVREIVEHVEKQPYADAVIGYQVAVFEGGEFMLPAGFYGFSSASEKAFRKWLQCRYDNDIRRLQKAWSDASVNSFSQVTVPTPGELSVADLGPFRDPQLRVKACDFVEFWQDCNADLLLMLAHTIKDSSKRNPLTGAFYGYLFECNQAFYKGHHALRRILDSSHIDFLAAPYSYVYRAPVWRAQPDADIGAGSFHGVVDSVLLNNKIFFSEDDSRTSLTTDSNLCKFPDIRGTIANLRRNHIVNLTRGVGLWRLDLYGSGWYDSDQLMKELGEQKRVTEALVCDSDYQRVYQPDVAVITDEKSAFYVASRTERDAGAQLSVDMFLRDHLHRAGVSFGVYLLDDLIAGRVPMCDVYLFAGTYAISSSAREWIAENLKSGGRTLIWLYGCGLYDENGWGVDKMSTLMELEIAQSQEPAPSGLKPCGALMSTLAASEWAATGITGFPAWYVRNCSENTEVLAQYIIDKVARPAVVLADKGNWKSLYIGANGLSPAWAHAIMQITGTHRYLVSDATVPCYVGHNIIGVWPTQAMHGTIHLKRISDVYDLYSGRLLHSKVIDFPVNLAQWEVKAFKIAERENF